MKIKMSILVSITMCFASMVWANTPDDTYTQKQAAERIVQQMFQSHEKTSNP